VSLGLVTIFLNVQTKCQVDEMTQHMASTRRTVSFNQLDILSPRLKRYFQFRIFYGMKSNNSHEEVTLSHAADCNSHNIPEAVFLVVCDPSMNEL
jgi:hypothetical protein